MGPIFGDVLAGMQTNKRTDRCRAGFSWWEAWDPYE